MKWLADGMQNKPINEVIAFIENKETARNANPSSGLSAISAYRHNRKNQIPSDKQKSRDRPSTNLAEREKTAQCPDCGKTFNLFNKRSRGGWNVKPHERCEGCWRKRLDSRRVENSAITQGEPDSFGQISTMSHKTAGNTLQHSIFTKGEWRRCKVMKHPEINLKLYPKFTGSKPVDIVGVADTGAQSDLWSMEMFLAAGFNQHDLSPASFSLFAANRSPIKINGAFHATLEGHSSGGSPVRCRTIIYVSQDVKCLYLSHNTMLELGIINHDFPTVGTFSSSEKAPHIPCNNSPACTTTHSIGRICGATKDDGAICDCPRRTTVPDRPTSLPFECHPNNNDKMKTWLFHRYQSSTFNVCPHQSLPEMTGPPVEIHLKEGYHLLHATKQHQCHCTGRTAYVPTLKETRHLALSNVYHLVSLWNGAIEWLLLVNKMARHVGQFEWLLLVNKMARHVGQLIYLH